MNPATTILYYVNDPMCSWCWGFRPVLLQLKQQLPPDIQLQTLVGGLAPDSQQPMSPDLQRDIQGAWQRIQQVIPGTRFNFDFWTKNTPRRSTYPACRAVIAARELADRADQMTYGIQQAYYLQARNPSDLDTLSEVASRIGLDAEAFAELMQSEQIHTLLAEELEQVRAIHVNSYPSLVLKIGDQLYPLKLDYLSAANILAEISHLRSSDS
ncbi:MAG: DsbA family protein [Gammaproteobacteria bacterium]|nr:DsbA family protein [Gammaproteobacteria bacterium]